MNIPPTSIQLHALPILQHLEAFVIWFGLEIWLESVGFGFNTDNTGRV